MNSKPKGYWTIERCIAEAAKHKTSGDFKRHCKGAWSAAHQKGWYKDITRHMRSSAEITAESNRARRKWTKEACLASAAEFNHVVDWQRLFNAAVTMSTRNGWYEECTAHMTPKENTGRFRMRRTIADCKAVALNYETRAEWSYGDLGSYKVACRNGWLEECCVHMTSKGSDNDVVYIWRDIMTGLHKIGITSDRLGEFRIGGFNKNVSPEIIFMLKVNDARAVENELLKLGSVPKLDKSIDGYTEFRILTDQELGEAVSIAYSMAAS